MNGHFVASVVATIGLRIVISVAHVRAQDPGDTITKAVEVLQVAILVASLLTNISSTATVGIYMW